MLARDDPPAVVVTNAGGASRFLLIGDHAGRAVPASLAGLGLAARVMDLHIALDIGVAALGAALSRRLDAAWVRQSYSRLVIDCNRAPGAAGSIPEVSDGVAIPGNLRLGPEEREARRAAIFDPYHDRIAAALGARRIRRRPTVLVSLHSFTPVYAGIARPWHVGTLYHRDARLPPLLLKQLRAEADLVVGDNEPYAVSNETDYTIPIHGEARGLMNTGIEIRQDLIGDHSGQQQWADRLARIFAVIEETLKAEAMI